MLFLAAEEESSILLSLIRTLLLDICNIIYKLIITFYELFLAVGDATILNSSEIQPIFSRVGLILGIIMLFRLMFSFVQYMIDPDKATDKESGVGSLIKKALIVVVALGTSEWIFTKAFDIQHIILEENTIGKIVLGASNSDDVDMGDFGVIFSYSLFENFFYQNPGLNDAALEKANSKGCGPDYFDGNSSSMKRYIATFKDFEVAHQCVNVDGKIDGGIDTFWGNKVYYVNFDGLTAIVVGGFVLWVLIMYTITLGVRVVKLAFLRIIAPVPILSYLSPKKDTAFQRWIKQCVTTYLDLFIRLAIIYFAMYLISVVFQAEEGGLNAATWLDPSSSLYIWFRLILVLGILLFAKKVPDLISDLFPGMGSKSGLDFGLGLKSRTDFLGKGVLKRAVGATAGAAAIGFLGAAQGFKRMTAAGEQATGKKRVLNTAVGAATGLARGMWYGAKGRKIMDAYKAQVGASAATNKYIASGGDDFKSRFASSVAREFGLPTAYDRTMAEVNAINRQIEANEKLSDASKNVYTGRDAIGDIIKGEIEGDKSKTRFSGVHNKAALDYLEKEGVLKIFSRDAQGNITDARFILGNELERDAQGTVIGTKEKYGQNIIGKKFSDVDNDIEGAIKIAENTLNTSNASLVTSQADKQKIVSKINSNSNLMNSLENEIRSFDSSTATPQEILENNEKISQYMNLQSEQATLQTKLASTDSDIIIQQRNVEDAEKLLSSINKTTLVKKLKESAMIELFLDNYDSADAHNDMITNFNQAVQAQERLKVEVETKMSSKNPNDVKIGEQFKQVEETMGLLINLTDDIRNNSEYFTLDSSGKKVYDVDKINMKIESTVSENKNLFDSAINLDDVNSNGICGIEKIEVKNIHDVWDKLADYNKKLERYKNRESAELNTRKEIIEQSAETMQERIADDNRLGGKN